MKPALKVNKQQLAAMVKDSGDIVQEEQLSVIKENIRALYRLRSELEATISDLERNFEKQMRDLSQRMGLVDTVLEEVSEGKTEALQKIKLNPDYFSSKSTNSSMTNWLASLKLENPQKENNG